MTEGRDTLLERLLPASSPEARRERDALMDRLVSVVGPEALDLLGPGTVEEWRDLVALFERGAKLHEKFGHLGAVWDTADMPLPVIERPTGAR